MGGRGHGVAVRAGGPRRRGLHRAGAARPRRERPACSPCAPWTRTCSPPRWRPGARPPSPSRSRRRTGVGTGGAAAQRAGGGRSPRRRERRRRLGAGAVRGARGAPRADRRAARPAVQRRGAARRGGRAQATRCRARPAGHGPRRGHGGPRRHRPRVRQRAAHRGAARPAARSGWSPRPGRAPRRSPPCCRGGGCRSRTSSASAGRDLSEAVEGRMAQLAVRALDRRPGHQRGAAGVEAAGAVVGADRAGRVHRNAGGRGVPRSRARGAARRA